MIISKLSLPLLRICRENQPPRPLDSFPGRHADHRRRRVPVAPPSHRRPPDFPRASRQRTCSNPPRPVSGRLITPSLPPPSGEATIPLLAVTALTRIGSSEPAHSSIQRRVSLRARRGLSRARALLVWRGYGTRTMRLSTGSWLSKGNSSYPAAAAVGATASALRRLEKMLAVTTCRRPPLAGMAAGHKAVRPVVRAVAARS